MQFPYQLQQFLRIAGPALGAGIYLYIFTEHIELWSDFYRYEHLIPNPSFGFIATAIYYLWTSPFSQRFKIPLSLALVAELFISAYSPDFTSFSLLIAFVFLPISILYTWRSLKKPRLTWADYYKMIISLLTICLFVIYNLVIFAEDGLLGEEWISEKEISYVFIAPAIGFCITSFLLVHIIMLYKDGSGKEQLQEELIDMIGQIPPQS